MLLRCAIAMAAAGALSACGAAAGGNDTPAPRANPAPATGPSAGAAAVPIELSAGACGDPFEGAGPLQFTTEGWKTDFCKHSVPYSELRGGGPPRDGIPPIDDPSFVTIAEAEAWISDAEPVIALELGGQAKLYPLQILTWHEVVNDTLGGTPVAVTFCPLCYAALSFERPRVSGELLTFGTSGNLRRSDLVMWDRQTESWWQQFDGEAIVGELTGTKLDKLPSAIVSWADAKQRYPDAVVLSKDTGHDRPYGRNPYVGYDDVAKKPFLYSGHVGEGLAPMEHVVGVQLGEASRAYALQDLRKLRAVNDTLGGVPLVVLWKPGAASALDTAEIAAGKDVGATGVFDRRVGDRLLSFEPAGDDAFRDRETRSRWNVFGQALAGPLQGTQLSPIVRHDVFWFAWSAFVPDVTVYEP